MSSDGLSSAFISCSLNARTVSARQSPLVCNTRFPFSFWWTMVTKAFEGALLSFRVLLIVFRIVNSSAEVNLVEVGCCGMTSMRLDFGKNVGFEGLISVFGAGSLADFYAHVLFSRFLISASINFSGCGF